ncbi:MAG: hypothetical protein WAL80_14590 [Xanthobacteraceae bacterium]|jgi:hypothetical protein
MKRGFALGSGSAFCLAWGSGSAFSLALALMLCTVGASPGWAQAQPPQCGQFQSLSQAAAQKASVVQAAMKTKADRKEVCAALTSFVTAESAVIKFLVDNKTWCGVPDQVIVTSKENHEKSMKFKTAACNDTAPRQKPPSLSDALGTPTVDSASNTKTGHGGTFDTLTGNPLGK